MMATADDALEIAAEVKFGEVGVLAAFTDDHEIGRRFEAPNGIHQRAVLLLDHDFRDSGGGEPALGFGENGAGFGLRDATLHLGQRPELSEEFGGRIEADRTGGIDRRGLFRVFQKVEDMDLRVDAARHPRGVVVDAGGVKGAIGAGKNRRHDRGGIRGF